MKAVNGSGPPPTYPVKGGELSLRYGTLDEEFNLVWSIRETSQPAKGLKSFRWFAQDGEAWKTRAPMALTRTRVMGSFAGA
jgi:hypothetical protein